MEKRKFKQTILCTFTLVDFKKSFNTDHFNAEKAWSKDFKTCLDKLVQMVQPVLNAQFSVLSTVHSTGAEYGSSHFPAATVYVLVDVLNQREALRTYALFQAYANYFQQPLRGFDFLVTSFDPQAKYRIDLRW